MKTIFGVATAIGKAGVAIIRISGNDALSVLAEFGCGKITPRQAEFRKLRHNSEVIDEAVVLYFHAPHSFTGEDIVELHTHGSRAVINKILNILGAMPNLRMAEPGEFSRRAFTNGKMDLTEAEGLADLIEAETDAQAKQAIRQMQGKLGKIYDKWRGDLIHQLAFIEAYIDFPDEDLPASLRASIEAGVNNLKAEIASHLNDNRKGEKIRDGLYVVIIGAPNVGKSSLLNYLAGRDAAIVSERAGTTRDIIEVHMQIAGYAVTIADTAGLRETADEIESEGITRALKRAGEADIKILMFEAGMEDAQTTALADEDSIIAINKIDKSPHLQSVTAQRVRDDEVLGISLTANQGLDDLLEALTKKITTKFALSESPLITRARHREALVKALAALENFSTSKQIELMSEDLRYAATAIGRITGKIEVDDILDVIFSSFCIGK